MVGRTKQGMLIARSDATPCREPCQGLTAAALSEFRRVPSGSFEGVTYLVSTSVWIVGIGAQYFVRNKESIDSFFFLYEKIDVNTNITILTKKGCST